MKKLLVTILSILAITTLLSMASLAAYVPFEDDYVADDEIVLASINGIKPFMGDLANPQPVEDALYWLSDYADKYNIKYVGFVGRFSSGSNHTYANCGNNQDLVISRNDADEELIKEYTTLRNFASVLTEVDVAYGISLHKSDYYSNALLRNNFVANHFGSEYYVGESEELEIDAYDNNNFAVIVHEGNTKYVVYNLEAYPRKAALDWFNTLNATHADKRAFIYTTSFADKSGAMFTQYDPLVYSYTKAPEKGNTTLKEAMVNHGKPFDGEQIWNYAFSKFDNIVMIMSANAEPGRNIVVTKFKNARGYETVSVVANLIGGYSSTGAFPVLAKFSEADKTLDLRYAVPYENKIGAYIEESKVVVDVNLAKLADPDPVSLLPKISSQLNGENKAYINGYAGNVFKPNANMTKAEASTIFARLLAGSQTLPTGNTTRFTDVKGHWAHDAIAYLDTAGFYFTNDSDKYYPDKAITRAEFVELAYFACNLDATESIEFTDVPENHKYHDAIMAGAAAGLVNGYADGSFKPDATITRAEVVTVINRMLLLVASSDTVDKSHITNVFGDINGHWAEYQILMASNSNVHGAYYYDVDTSALTETNNTISFATKHVKIDINKKNGKVDKIIYLPTGENLVGSSTAPWFSYVKTHNGATISPKKVELIDGRLKFTYSSDYSAYFIVEVFDDYFTVELDSNISNSLKSVLFGNMTLDYVYTKEAGNPAVSAFSFDTKAHVPHRPGGKVKTTSGRASNIIAPDIMGAKMGIVVSDYADLRQILMNMQLAVDPSRGIMSDHGGAWAPEAKNNDVRGDYVILSSGLNPQTAEQTAELAAKYSIDQIDVHQGYTFTQGDFNFKCASLEGETGFVSASTFKERIADKIKAKGVQLGLHTYSTLVASTATTILTDPKWQKQISTNPVTYTLRGDLTKFRGSIKTYEDASQFKVSSGNIGYTSKNTRYILIDEEIILVQQGTTSGFLNCTRGQLGTKPQTHKDGAKIYQLQGWYSMFQPIPGSELFYYVAEQTAKAYNEGGFEMLYLDGFEAFFNYVDDTELEDYYKAEFIRVVLEGCEKKPIFEASTDLVQMWPARARGGAIDNATKNYKRQKAGHAENVAAMADHYFSGTLGWVNYAPDADEKYKNMLNKTLFHDDLDHMGSIAIGYGLSTVCQPFSIEKFADNTRLAENFGYYSVYSRLRKANYFAPEVRKQLINSEYEHRVFKQADGSWAFREMKYEYNKIYDNTDTLFATGKGNNPFAAQTPFIRIEQRYSTLSENEILVYELDETKDISAVKGKKTLKNLDLSQHYAIKVKVYGNGASDSGIVFSFSSASGGRTDYFVPTSHTGWREFILMDADNADTGLEVTDIDTKWSNYDTYRTNPERKALTSMTITTAGNMTGVKVDDVRAYTLVDAPAKNPSVTIGGSTITFNTEIHSGEYIEFYPETGKAYLNYYVDILNDKGNYKTSEAHTKEISYTGTVTAPSGAYSYTYGAEAMTDAPLRAQVKIGLSGKIIANPADWIAPEVDMGDATLDIVIR